MNQRHEDYIEQARQASKTDDQSRLSRFGLIKKSIGQILIGLIGAWVMYGAIILIEIMTGNLGFEYAPYEVEFDLFALALALSAFIYFLFRKKIYIALGILLFLIFNETSLNFIGDCLSGYCFGM